LENIPADGPVIFAGNHPNALMDGWLLIAKCERWPLYFLADAKLWQYRMLVPMLNAAGLGVAYHARTVVKESARHAISNFGLDSVLYLMGFSDRDIEQALDGRASNKNQT
ncbi:MAG: hypothetical protein IH908_03790, partial [Proteobacteria bacterium]|nr:hypothetical protein [Pseudomonadota bacterium]